MQLLHRSSFSLHAEPSRLLKVPPFRLCASDSRRSNGPDPSSRRPRNRSKPRLPKLTKQPPQEGILGNPESLQELQGELSELYQRLDDTGKAQMLRLAQASDEGLLREQLHAMDGDQLKAHVDTVFNKYNNPSFWEATLMQPLALDVIRERLPAEDSELLGKLLVSNEATGDIGTGLNTNRPLRIGRQLLKLKLHERRRLPGLLARLEEMEEDYQLMGEWKNYIDTKLAIRLMRRAKQKGLAPEEFELRKMDVSGAEEGSDGPEEDEGQEAESQQLPSSADGFEPQGLTADRIRSSSNGASTSSSGSSGGGSSWGSSFRRRGRPGTSAASGSSRVDEGSPWGPAPPSERAQQVASLVAEQMDQYVTGDGWEQEQGSQELQRLKRLVAKLSVLAQLSVDNLEDSDLSPRQYLKELNNAMREVQLMAITGSQSEDPVVRDSIDYMSGALMTEDANGSAVLDCELQTVARLARFVKAAEVWEQYKAFYISFLENRQSFSVDLIEDFTAVLGELDRDKWWVKEEEDLSEEERAEMASSNCTAVVDEDRIKALASADPTELRFLSELLGSGYSEEALIKWSMHPVIGAKLRSGNWMGGDGMSDIVKEAWQEAVEGEDEVEGIDFDYKVTPANQGPDDNSRPSGAPPKTARGRRGLGRGGIRRRQEKVTGQANRAANVDQEIVEE